METYFGVGVRTNPHTPPTQYLDNYEMLREFIHETDHTFLFAKKIRWYVH